MGGIKFQFQISKYDFNLKFTFVQEVTMRYQYTSGFSRPTAERLKSNRYKMYVLRTSTVVL